MKNLYAKIRDQKFDRRTKPILDRIKYTLNSTELPFTVRQLYYILLESGIETGAKDFYQQVSYITSKARYAGELPWDRIVDETRRVYKTPSYDSINDAISQFLKDFRLNGRWKDTKSRIEVWVEKATLHQLCEPITDKYDVYLAVGRGETSTSAIWQAVQRLARYNTKRVDILYFGDLDPTGDDMPRTIKSRLREFIGLSCTYKGGIECRYPWNINVHKILIKDEDLETFKIHRRELTESQKKKLLKDTRAKGFIEKHGDLFQVEMEALSPQTIAEVLETEIKKYVDLSKHMNTSKFEKEEVDRVEQLLKKKLGWQKLKVEKSKR